MSSPVVDIFPPSFEAAGYVRVQYVKTLADPKNPTTAELTAATSFDATCYFMADALQINHDQATNNDTRLCDKTARESFGRSTYSLADALSYVYNPQDKTADTPGNLAYTRFVPGEKGYFVTRFGNGPDTESGDDFAAAQLVDVYSVTFGTQHKPIPTGDNAKFVIQQPLTLAREAEGVALAA